MNRNISNFEIMTGRNVAFDIARSFSMIFIIAIHHLSGYTGQPIASISYFASLVVTTLGVFVFLSGFLLGGKYEFHNLNDVIYFYKKRVLRIIPLFILASVSLIYIGMNGWTETIKGIWGVSMLWKPAPATLWFVSMLLLFYFVTPLLANRKGYKQFGFGLSAFIIMLCIDFIWHSVDKRVYFYFLIYWLGIYLAIHKPRIISSFSKKEYTIVISAYFLLTMLCFLHKNKVVEIALGGIGILAIFMISHQVSKSLNLRIIKIINFISYGSMCSYLFHRVIYWTVLQFYMPEHPLEVWIYLLFIAVPIVIIIGYYIQIIYDYIILSISNYK